MYEAMQKPTMVDVDLGQKPEVDIAKGYSEEEVEKLIDTLKIRELDIGEEHIGNLCKLIRKYASVIRQDKRGGRTSEIDESRDRCTRASTYKSQAVSGITY